MPSVVICRNSKLTFRLQDALGGGNSKLLVIACISTAKQDLAGACTAAVGWTSCPCASLACTCSKTVLRMVAGEPAPGCTGSGRTDDGQAEHERVPLLMTVPVTGPSPPASKAAAAQPIACMAVTSAQWLCCRRCPAAAETKETLRFAEMARAIKNTPTVNREPKDELIHRLEQQVAELQDQLRMAQEEGGKPATDEVLAQLYSTEAELADVKEKMVGHARWSGRLLVWLPAACSL